MKEHYSFVKILAIKSKKFHVIIAALLGALPGCGGAIIVVTQYIQKRIGFGSLVAVLTSTMGDAAFLLLAIEPQTGLFIFSIGAIVGISSGYIVDTQTAGMGIRYQLTDNLSHFSKLDYSINNYKSIKSSASDSIKELSGENVLFKFSNIIFLAIIC